MLIDFNGRNVLVLGCAYGIGEAIVRRFAISGARVTAGDIQEIELQRHRDEGRWPGTVIPLHTDVLVDDDLERAVAVASGESGRLDVLVYVAGGIAGEKPQPLENVSGDSWRKIIDVNLSAAFHACRAVTGVMKAARHGRIVVISSIAGLKPSLSGIQSYCAAKHGVVGLVKQLSLELAPFGITVNSIAPGFMLTSRDATRQWEGWSVSTREAHLGRLVGGRLGEPEDIADAAAFLASERASWISGQILPVSGGPL